MPVASIVPATPVPTMFKILLQLTVMLGPVQLISPYTCIPVLDSRVSGLLAENPDIVQFRQLPPPQVTENERLPTEELESIIMSSTRVGAEAPTVAAEITEEATVPPIETVQVFPEPPVIVPMFVVDVTKTVIPVTSAGEPVVVSVVPEQEPVKVTADAVDQLVVNAALNVPVPPTQYLVAIYCPKLSLLR
jgi:hypothetical protein